MILKTFSFQMKLIQLNQALLLLLTNQINSKGLN